MGELESRKRNFISIDEEAISSSEEEDETSSSSLSGENSEDHSEWSANEEGEENSEEDDGEEHSEGDDDEEEDSKNDEGGVIYLGLKNAPVDDQVIYNRVIHLLKGVGDLQSLKHEECKVYLRKHGLRLSGTKSVCIQRIQEHWRIKDGGEKLYPWSSFTINCTGDVCKGDVVKFIQKVYEKFDKVSRTGNLRGKRTVAGRVVKESYGAAKQQHTFTVEVLWSRGLKKLPPLFPLLVKGRNLYRMKTFRQPWDNEAERSKVLFEKHKRGSVARHLRAAKRASAANGGPKRQKHSHHAVQAPNSGRSREAHPARKAEWKRATSCGNAPREVMEKSRRVSKSRATKPSSDRDLQPSHYKENGIRPQIFHPSNKQFNFSNNEIGSTSTHTRRPSHHPYSTVEGTARPHHRHAYPNPANQFNPRKFNHCQEHTSNSRRMNTVPPRAAGFYRGVNSNLPCSTHGCLEQRHDKCFGLLCWRCCRISTRWCYSHR